MKKILLPILSVVMCITIFSRCSAEDDFLNSKRAEKTNFPKHIENYGKAIAKEISQTVQNLNEMGVDYSDAENTSEFKDRFYNDLTKASPAMTRSGIPVDDMQIDPATFIDRYRNLTPIQIKFIERIIEETQKSSSLDDFTNRLLNINRDIYDQVPEIEQERLFFVSATLYYSVPVFEDLKRQGQMLITPYSSMPMVKTGGESGDDGFWGACRSYYAAIALSVGTYINWQEVVTAVTKVAGQALFLVTVCITMTGDTSASQKCDKLRDECVSYPYTKDGRRKECANCYRYCLNNYGNWNFTECPRP